MRRKFWNVLLCLALGLGLLSVTAGAVVEPTEAFYVADYADVLSADTEQYIIDKNQTLFDTTGGQIVVVTVEFMDGMDSADYAMQVVENWGGIGDVDRDNGFLLVYAVGENKVWAMTGSGLEDALPASQIERYLEEYFYDDYDAQSYDRGTRDFFDAIYAWYESYYAGNTGGGEQDFHYYPEAEPDYVYGYVGPVFGFGVFGLMGLIILLVILACFFSKEHLVSDEGVDIQYTLFGMVSHNLWRWDEITTIHVDRKRAMPDVALHIGRDVATRLFVFSARDADAVLALAKEKNPAIRLGRVAGS